MWTRTLREVTDGVPELVERVRALPCETVVLDGETLALDDDGRPRAFQDTMSRFGSDASDAGVLLSPFFFDLLLHEGDSLIETPARERLDRLDSVVPEAMRVARLVTDSPSQAQDFFDRAIADGQEGVIIKRLDAPYDAGRRGSAWTRGSPGWPAGTRPGADVPAQPDGERLGRPPQSTRPRCGTARTRLGTGRVWPGRPRGRRTAWRSGRHRSGRR